MVRTGWLNILARRGDSSICAAYGGSEKQSISHIQPAELNRGDLTMYGQPNARHISVKKSFKRVFEKGAHTVMRLNVIAIM